MTEEVEPRLRVAVIGGDDHEAIEQIVRHLPSKPGLSLVISAPQAHAIADRLRSSLPVHAIRDTTTLEPERVYLLPDERESTVQTGAIVVEPPNGRGSLDRLMRSVADSYGRSAIGVIVAGRGHDGALGIKRVKEVGGVTICQHVDNAGPRDLPQSALATGAIDLVLTAPEIGPRLAALANGPQVNVETTASDELGDFLRDIITMIRIRTGHDFRWYKRATLYRRLARRMQVCQTETIAEYYRFLREHPNELNLLLRDFLISVTNFFRDPEAWEALAQQLIPRIFHGKGPTDQVRVWVAGCATGEEAYSIGILLAEHAAHLLDGPQLQVFATNIDEEALAEARAGVYPESIATDVSLARLDRFFTRENGNFRVAKELREMMLFSPHNLLRDPPFSRLDLVSCRNLLIYLNRDAQDRALSTFHFALKPEGYLFLGSSESADGSNLFSALDAKYRLFERRLAPSGLTTDALIASARWLPTGKAFTSTSGEQRSISSFGELHYRIVEQLAPPSVLINEDLEIVHLSEHAGKFFTLGGGEPTRQILRLVHPGLRFELRGAIYASRQPDRHSDTRTVRFDDNGQTRTVEIRVRRVDLPEAGRGTLLVMLDELESRDTPNATPAEAEHQNEPVMREMEEELHRAREQLRTTVEQYETSLEELKASNEELHAINEELRSATEELETSKEELQSVNEELTTLNHELKVKIDEVSRANNDLQNLMTSTDIGVLFLDRQLNIKRFKPRIQELFNIIPSDIGRPIQHLTHVLDCADLTESALRVLQDLHTIDREVQTRDGNSYLARFLPYRSLDDRIEGVVLTFVDVSELKRVEAAHKITEATLRTIEQRLALALRAAPLAVISQDEQLAVTWAFVQGKELDPTARNVEKIFAGGHADVYQSLAREVTRTGHGQRVELDVALEGETRTYDFRLEPLRDDVGNPMGLTSVGFDITPTKTVENAFRETDRRRDEFLATVSHELRNPLTPLRVAFDVVRLAKDPAQIAPAIQIMDHQLRILVRLVDDLLDMSRMTLGKLNLVPSIVDPVRILESALETTRPLIDQGGQQLHVTLPDTTYKIRGDVTRLTQVLVNLLMNAIKYTKRGSRVDVIVRADQSWLVIDVRDDGAGIAPELLPRVFDLFVQGDETDRSKEARGQGGLGIGLNLVRRIVELHGGKVRAASDGLGKGATFTVELPLAKAD